MCGIVGYVGSEQASPILLEGLSKLEYRGYDSAGIAVFNEGKIEIAKAKGRLAVLEEKTHNGATVHGTMGIGHTRWATHGERRMRTRTRIFPIRADLRSCITELSRIT